MNISNFDAIQEHLNGERDEYMLTEKQVEYFRQLRSAYAMLLDLHPKAKIAKRLMANFDISQQVAYKVIRETETLFGSIQKVNKEFLRVQAIEMAKKAYRRAQKLDKPKEMIAATIAFVKAAGLDVNDPDLPDFEKLQPNLVVTVLPEGMEQDIRRMLQSGAVNLNKAPIISESIDYEEVKENDAG